jgi:CRP/FNR family transcriptional regulator, cyclic AMP receptor protein
MRVNFVNVREILELTHWFRSCPPDLQRSLIDQARVVEIPAGQYLFRRGDPATGMYCLVDGRLSFGGGEGAKDSLLAIVQAPYWFGEAVLFDDGERTTDARADGPAMVLNIPQEAAKELLEREPRYWRELGLLAVDKARRAFQAIEQASSGTSLARLACRILAIFDGYGLGTVGQKAVLTASQEQLALMLGLSRQTVNQLLGKLEDQAAIRRGYGNIEVLDPVKLAQIGGLRA